MASNIPTDRFGNPAAKTGPDYSRLKQILMSSNLQKEDNNLYQVLLGLVDGARTSQGFIEERFNTQEANHTSAFANVRDINDELENVRNNSKFSVSLANSITQTIPTGVLTEVSFDTVIFDDGLLFDIDNNIDKTDITLNSNGQFYITASCKFNG